MTSNFHSAEGSVAMTGGGSAGDVTRPPTCGASGDSDSSGAGPRFFAGAGGGAGSAAGGGGSAIGGAAAGGVAAGGGAAAGAVCANTSDDHSGRTTNELDTIKERLMVRIIP